MRIAFFTDSFLPFVNGVITTTVNSAEQLAALGHEVHIIAPQSKGFHDKKTSFRVFRTPSIPYRYKDFRLGMIGNPALYRYLKKHRIEVIHFQSPATLGMEAVLMSRLLRVPLVATHHTLMHLKEYQQSTYLSNPLISRALWPYHRFVYKKCDLVTTPAPSTTELLETQGVQHCETISNGITFDFKPGIPKPATLVYVGRVSSEKSMETLFEAFAQVRESIPRAELLIVGDGPQRKELEAKKIPGVTFIGQLPPEVFRNSMLLSSATLFVSASNTENQPMTVLEALSCGVPCVVPDACGMPDVVSHGVNGALFPPDDSTAMAQEIITLLKQPAVRQTLSKGAFASAEKHEIKNVIKRWEDAYASLLKKDLKSFEPVLS